MYDWSEGLEKEIFKKSKRLGDDFSNVLFIITGLFLILGGIGIFFMGISYNFSFLQMFGLMLIIFGLLCISIAYIYYWKLKNS